MDFNRFKVMCNFNPYLDTIKVFINTCFIVELNSLQLNLTFRNNLIKLEELRFSFIKEFSLNYTHCFNHSLTKAISYKLVVIFIQEHCPFQKQELYRSKFTKNSSLIQQACLEDLRSL